MNAYIDSDQYQTTGSHECSATLEQTLSFRFDFDRLLPCI